MRLGFKGFDKTLSCRTTKFEVGVTYETNFHAGFPSLVPSLCSEQGFHYCDTLNKVFAHYVRNNGNRFCIIEDLGRTNTDRDKSTTTKFRIVAEITDIVADEAQVNRVWLAIVNAGAQGEQARNVEEEAIRQKLELDKQKREMRALVKAEAELEVLGFDAETNKQMADGLNLPALKLFQEKFPMCHVGGSLGLFLHGVRLDRFSKAAKSDLDIIMPYFTLFESTDGMTVKWNDAKKSANDFDETFMCTTEIGTFKVDVKIDPKQRYEIVEYEGFKYKVSKLETILEAKMRYSLNGQTKHLQDIYEMCGKTKWQSILAGKTAKTPDTEERLPW